MQLTVLKWVNVQYLSATGVFCAKFLRVYSILFLWPSHFSAALSLFYRISQSTFDSPQTPNV